MSALKWVAGAALVAGLGGYALGRQFVESSAAPADARAAVEPESRRKLDALLESQARLQAQIADLQGRERAPFSAAGAAQAAEAMRLAAAANDATTSGPLLAPAAAPRTSEGVEAQSAARATLERAIAAGRWTSADRDQFRAALSRLDGDAATEAVRSFAVAVNSGKLALAEKGTLPF